MDIKETAAGSPQADVASRAVRWSGLLTDADRWAAGILSSIIQDFRRYSTGSLTQHPKYAEIRACDEPRAAALLTGTLAIQYCDDWSVALGFGSSSWLHRDQVQIQQLQKTLLRRKFDHRDVHQHVLLLCLVGHSRWSYNRIPGLLERLMAWADRHPGQHTEAWQLVCRHIGGCDLSNMASKLRKYCQTDRPPMLVPLEACAKALVTHQTARRQTNEWGIWAYRSSHAGFDIEENGEGGDQSGWDTWSADGPGLRLGLGDPEGGVGVIDPTYYPPPSLTEFEALAPLLREVPASPVAALLANVVACLARQMTVDSRSVLYSSLQALGDRCAAWEADRVIASKRALTCAEEALARRWPIETPTLLMHLDRAAGNKPSAKWMKELDRIVRPEMRADLANSIAMYLDHGFASRRYFDPLEARIKGLIWASALCPAELIAAPIARFAHSVCFQKIAGVGMRNEGLGNTCLWALVSLPDGGGVPHLSRLLARVTYPKTKKLIEAALNEAANKAGISRGTLDEISVPTHDLDSEGKAQILVGGGAAHLAIDGTASVALTWRAPDGKLTKSLPAAMKAAKDEIKAVRARVKEIEANLSVQPWRIQRIWLDDRRWQPEHWRQRYVAHPLLGALSRRLIWNLHVGNCRTAGMWQNGALVAVDGRQLDLDDGEISLWHPVGSAVEEVLAWRERIAALGIVQPFKQAHREVYLITDAERTTRVYSNRFAGHIIKQHQMQALARLNGWAMTTHMGYDGGMGKYPSRIALPSAGLIAEYWLEGVGDTDYSPNGAFLYLSTDQLRFVRPANMDAATRALGKTYDGIAGEAVPIEAVPPLLLSEIMRHCDLFVGVSSIANDPNWIDAGADVSRGHWRQDANTYWHDRSFGAIGAAGDTRRGLLMALLPSLAIGKVSRIDGNFLRVAGKRRAYKIHLGSGNILMEPNDQYLCIVPSRSAAQPTVRLPFEGDTVLSIILSKAALLAADDKITDPTILSQLDR